MRLERHVKIPYFVGEVQLRIKLMQIKECKSHAYGVSNNDQLFLGHQWAVCGDLCMGMHTKETYRRAWKILLLYLHKHLTMATALVL